MARADQRPVRFHRDELATVDDARFLAWGYVAYPPAVPSIARVALELFGASLVGLRLFSSLAMCAAMVLSGLMARELGGSRHAQLLTAMGVAIAPIGMLQSALFQYVAFLTIRLLRTENPRWWLAIGAAIGLGMLTKYTIGALVIGLAAGVILTANRRFLTSPWLWAGAALAILIWLPNAIWQAQNELVSLEFLRSIHARDVAMGRTDGFLLEQLIACANPVTIPLWTSGLYFYLGHPEGKRYRLIGFLFVVPFSLLLALQGRSYYLAPAYPMLIAAGSVSWARWLESLRPARRKVARAATWGAVALAGVLFAGVMMPVAPIDSALWNLSKDVHDDFSEQIGWDDLTDEVAGIYAELPEDERAQAGILTANYGEAAAIDLYGRALGLPEAISGVNSYWARGYRDAADRRGPRLPTRTRRPPLRALRPGRPHHQSGQSPLAPPKRGQKPLDRRCGTGRVCTPSRHTHAGVPSRIEGIVLARRIAVAAALVVATSWIVGSPRPALATCNMIPLTRPEVPPFRAARGSLDRPFATPGDFVTIRVRKSEGLCDRDPGGHSAELADYDGSGGEPNAADVLVTVLFEPVASFADPATSATRNVVVLAPSCAQLDVPSICSGGPRNGQSCASGCPNGACLSQRAACDAQLARIGLAGRSTVSCIEAQQGDVQALATEAVDEIIFEFPDTDALLPTFPTDDDLTLAGPATIAVTPVTSAIPCGLAATPDPSQLPGAPHPGRCANVAGQIACVDELFEVNGQCSLDPDEIVRERPNGNRTFSYFTALPPANSYKKLCETASQDLAGDCEGSPIDMRFAVDRDGNALVPMNYAAIRKEKGGYPIARILKVTTNIDSFPGAPTEPLDIPIIGCGNAGSFTQSLAPEGYQVSPLVSPLANAAAIFGSADADEGIFRIQRRGNDFGECQGGTDAGKPCNCSKQCSGEGTCLEEPVCHGGTRNGFACTNGSATGDAACPDDPNGLDPGECGPAVFDAKQFLMSGIGPAVLSDAQVDLDTDGHIPLEGLYESDALFAFVSSERDETASVGGDDPNNDDDWTDWVVSIRDKATGSEVPIDCASGGAGEPACSVARVRAGAARIPALALEGSLVALLVPEALEGWADRNGDLDRADTMLWVFDASQEGPYGGAEPIVGLVPADAEPVIDGKPIRISNGLTFFRRLEWISSPWITEKVNVTPSGAEADTDSTLDDASSDHDFVAFSTTSGSLLPGVDTNGYSDVYLRDRADDLLFRVSRADNDDQSNATSWGGRVSEDGCHTAFMSWATNLVTGQPIDGAPDIFVRFYDRNADGVCSFVTADRATRLVGLNSQGLEIDDPSLELLDISGDGRFVYFKSTVDGVVPGDDNGVADIFVRDRNSNGDFVFDDPANSTTTRISIYANGSAHGPSTSVFDAAFTPDERYMLVNSSDGPGPDDVTLLDRNADEDEFLDEPAAMTAAEMCTSAGGVPGDGLECDGVDLSADARFVTLDSTSANLEPGSNLPGSFSLFLRDRDGDGDGTPDEINETSVERVDVASDGTTNSRFTTSGTVTDDGRFVAFWSTARNLVPNDTNQGGDVFVRDRVAGVTHRVSLKNSGVEANNSETNGPTLISEGGRDILFQSRSSNLVSPNDPDQIVDVFSRHVNETVCPGGNGNSNCTESLLHVIDESGQIVEFGIAKQASVSRGVAAFVRGTDSEVRFSLDPPSDTVASLGLRGDHVWLSDAPVGDPIGPMRLAALASEALMGNLNGDGDSLDQVLQQTPVPTSLGGAAAWSSSGQAADTAAFSGDRIVFASSERDQASTDVTSDGDVADRYLQVWNAAAPGAPTKVVDDCGVVQPIQDFVVGAASGSIVALRTRESDFCNANGGACSAVDCHGQLRCDLNSDTDCDDDVMQVWDPVAGFLKNTETAVAPCLGEICDPQLPYRVNSRTVTFLTFEGSHGVSLNADTDAADLLLHSFATPSATGIAAQQSVVPRMAAQTSAGKCTDTGAACASDLDCGGTRCLRPPGVCLEHEQYSSTAGALSTNPGYVACEEGATVGCPAGELCRRYVGTWNCRAVQLDALGNPLPCDEESDCTSQFSCVESAELRMQTPADGTVGALSGGGVDGRQQFAGKGRCLETLTNPPNPSSCVPGGPEICEAGAFCGTDGTCQRQRGLCTVQEDCQAGTCVSDEILSVGASDIDADGVPDPLDNCLGTPNPTQDDLDGDEIGDDCDGYVHVCGNGILEPGPGDPSSEQCDDGDLVAGDGCDERCRDESLNECANGFDDDGDGKIDYATVTPPGETPDPGCKDAGTTAIENPQCNNGIDDDGDDRIDYAPPTGDTRCKSAKDNDERTDPPCGIGAELILLALLFRVRGHRRRARVPA